jgi:exopolysaccharide production protein ExoZ
VLEFAVGAGLGLLRAHGSTVPSPARAALALAALAAFVLAGGAERDGFARALFWGAPAACLVAACGLGRPGPHRRESVPIRLAVILGDASYALYLIHPFAIRGTRELVRAFGLAPILPPWGFVLLGLALAAGVACLLHRLVERPLTGWLRGVLGEARSGERPCPPIRVDGA